MMWRPLVLTAALAAVAADAPKDEANKKDLARVQGVWKVASATHGGKDAPPETVERMQLTFDGNKVTASDGNKEEPATFELDATKKPAMIDIVDKKNERVIQAIYEIDGDTLKVCFGRPGEGRPKEFSSKPDTTTVLMVLKRAKK
jgi:uncharacterized protein (TIGR03067 family)